MVKTLTIVALIAALALTGCTGTDGDKNNVDDGIDGAVDVFIRAASVIPEVGPCAGGNCPAIPDP